MTPLRIKAGDKGSPGKAHFLGGNSGSSSPDTPLLLVVANILTPMLVGHAQRKTVSCLSGLAVLLNFLMKASKGILMCRQDVVGGWRVEEDRSRRVLAGCFTGMRVRERVFDVMDEWFEDDMKLYRCCYRRSLDPSVDGGKVEKKQRREAAKEVYQQPGYSLTASREFTSSTRTQHEGSQLRVVARRTTFSSERSRNSHIASTETEYGEDIDMEHHLHGERREELAHSLQTFKIQEIWTVEVSTRSSQPC